MTLDEINQMLRAPRGDCFYEPSETDTLDNLEQFAQERLLNGPEGNDAVLRLIGIIRQLLSETAVDVSLALPAK